jgi:hypothetical protein
MPQPKCLALEHNIKYVMLDNSLSIKYLKVPGTSSPYGNFNAGLL